MISIYLYIFSFSLPISPHIFDVNFYSDFNFLFQFILLYFTVPPNIDDSLSSSDVIVREGSNITLKCRASGSPTPTIKVIIYWNKQRNSEFLMLDFSLQWKRDDSSRININKSLNGKKKSAFLGNQFSEKELKVSNFLFTVIEWDSDTLEITRISRLDMGAYLCIASNSVPPSVSKRIKVSVDCK